jgi:zinc/manganese transport system substrate-binding protein
MNSKLVISAVLLTAVLLNIFSCSGPSTQTGKKSIVVTYSILGSVVKELVGDQANITISVPNGQDPHQWSPSAKDIEAINKADLVVQNGLGLEGGLEKTLEQAQKNGVKFFTCSDHITIRYVGAGEGIPSGDPDQAIGSPDPHLWTDPVAIKSIVADLSIIIKNELGIDLTDQANVIETKLDSLNSQVASTVDVLAQTDRNLVTGHESMGYFAQRYGFKLVGVVIPSLTSQAGVSAADLAVLKDTILKYHVKAIFAELGTSPAIAQQIAVETGTKVVELTTHAVPADGSYFTYMMNLADTITNALK